MLHFNWIVCNFEFMFSGNCSSVGITTTLHCGKSEQSEFAGPLQGLYRFYPFLSFGFDLLELDTHLQGYYEFGGCTPSWCWVGSWFFMLMFFSFGEPHELLASSPCPWDYGLSFPGLHIKCGNQWLSAETTISPFQYPQFLGLLSHPLRTLKPQFSKSENLLCHRGPFGFEFLC